jgi:CelD/BcsL family acetyltransferase involved in cellulose biosynthesis
LIQTVARKKRKLGREVGPVRFEFECHDRRSFDQVLAWKSAQRRRTKTPDVLKFAWVVELLERLWQRPATDCFAPLSCMYAGDRLVAGHLGIGSSAVLHYWFPAYDPEMSKYSPGLLLLLEMAQSAAERGIQRFEFGKGMESWKREWKSGAHQVAEGAVDLRPVTRLVQRNWFRTRRWIKASPLRGPAEFPKRFVRHLQNWAMMR